MPPHVVVRAFLAGWRPCPVCLRRAAGAAGACPACLHRWLAVAADALAAGDLLALGPYRGGLGRLVRAAKYRPDHALLDRLGATLGHAARRAWPADDCAFVPVPGDPRRTRRRGVDHAARLATAAARAWGPGARVVPALRRRRATRPQAGLDDAQRHANLRGAIVWTGAPLTATSVVLVDDVLTTGATARACREALATVGVARPRMAVVARARGAVASPQAATATPVAAPTSAPTST